jgi:hypothetical protein
MEPWGRIGLQCWCFAGKSSGAFSCRQQSGVREASLSAADKWIGHYAGFWVSIERSSTIKDRRNEMQDTGATRIELNREFENVIAAGAGSAIPFWVRVGLVLCQGLNLKVPGHL